MSSQTAQEAPAMEGSPAPRRLGITAKIVALALVPLALIGLIVLVYLALALPRAYERVVRDSGRAALELLVGTLGARPEPTDLLGLPRFAGTPLSVVDLRVPDQGNATFVNDDGSGRFSVGPFVAFAADWSRDVAQTLSARPLSGGQTRSYVLVRADVYRTPQGLVPHFLEDRSPAPPARRRTGCTRWRWA